MNDGIYPQHRWFEDFAVGQGFVFGAWKLDRAEMLSFAERYDPEPFHVDEDAARALGWGGLIASGPLLAAIWRRLSKDAFPNTETVISPGWDDLRWLKPVFAGDVLRSRSEVVETRTLKSRAGEGLIRLSNDVLTQRDEVVMHAVSNWFVRCRPAA